MQRAWLRYTRLGVFLPFVVAALACSGNQSATPVADTSQVEPTPPVTITWSFWGDEWELAQNQRIVRAFEREHPSIRVQIAHHSWSTYFGWLRDEWQAGRSPDVMFLNYIPSYVLHGELEPLDRYLARDWISLEDFYPALLDSFRSEGRLYGLPRDNDTKVIYYNRAHFAEAGIPEPVAGWTWNDLRNAALALTRRDAPSPRYGFGFEPDYWWLVWLWQNGGDVLDDPAQPTKVTLDSAESVSALQFLQNLITVDRVTPPAAQMNTDEMSRLFREGRLSMVFGNHTLVPPFSDTAGLSWNVAPLPQAAVRANVAGGAGFVMSRRSQHKDAAWELIEFLTSRKGQAMLAESGLVVPARRSVREDSIFLRKQPYNSNVFLAETELGRPVPNFPGATEMARAIDTGLASLWRGERSAAEVVRDLVPLIGRAIGLSGF